MKKNLLFILVFILAIAGMNKISAQQSKASVVGTWKVADVMIADKDTSKPSGLQKENSFLGYMMLHNMPVEFKDDGTVELRKENERFTWKYEVNGDEIKFIAVEGNYGQASINEKPLTGNLVTYVIFRLEKNGNRITISRDNKLMSENYILEQ